MATGRTNEWTYESKDRQTDHLTYEWTLRPSHCGNFYKIDALSTGPIAHPLAHSFVPSLMSSSTRSFARSAHSLAPTLMGKSLSL